MHSIRRVQHALHMAVTGPEALQPVTQDDVASLHRLRDRLLEAGTIDHDIRVQQLALLPLLSGWPSQFQIELLCPGTQQRHVFRPPAGGRAPWPLQTISLTECVDDTCMATHESGATARFRGPDAAVQAVLWQLGFRLGGGALHVVLALGGQSRVPTRGLEDMQVAVLRIRAQMCDLVGSWLRHCAPGSLPRNDAGDAGAGARRRRVVLGPTPVADQLHSTPAPLPSQLVAPTRLRPSAVSTATGVTPGRPLNATLRMPSPLAQPPAATGTLATAADPQNARALPARQDTALDPASAKRPRLQDAVVPRLDPAPGTASGPTSPAAPSVALPGELPATRHDSDTDFRLALLAALTRMRYDDMPAAGDSASPTSPDDTDPPKG